MQAAATVRQLCDADPFSPVCVYDLCERLGVTVRFAAVSMEGMYDRFPIPRIHLSALRPMGRRAFTCAHELGHHYFKHGTTVDRLIRGLDMAGSRNEALANLFAAHLLMPSAGLRMALVARNIQPPRVTAPQVFSLSAMFGVGYGTMLRQLHSGLNFISKEQFVSLSRTPPRRIVRDVLGETLSGVNLRLIDAYWRGGTLDVEKGDILLCPPGTEAAGSLLKGDHAGYPLFVCSSVGLANVQIPRTSSAIFVRVQERNYVGLAKFRHLEVEE
jgi:hypothetical protein